MLYIALLIILTLAGSYVLLKLLNIDSQKREKAYQDLKAEFQALEKESAKLKESNLGLTNAVNQTIELYNITKDICKTLDEKKIFSIFKEKIKEYMEIRDCQFVDRNINLARFKDYTILPLVIHKEAVGYLAASGIKSEDKEMFLILANQFLIGIKRALLYKEIQELSITDSLTLLFSRRHFIDRLKEEISRSRKFKHKLAFLMVDIDRFKDFNDKYGHLVGDAILKEVSKAIKETVRQIDFVGRYGGEELTIVLAESDREQARFAAERLRQVIESKVIKAYDEVLKVTISIGVSIFPSDAESVETLIETADKALYLAKQTGRNKVCFYGEK